MCVGRRAGAVVVPVGHRWSRHQPCLGLSSPTATGLPQFLSTLNGQPVDAVAQQGLQAGLSQLAQLADLFNF